MEKRGYQQYGYQQYGYQQKSVQPNGVRQYGVQPSSVQQKSVQPSGVQQKSVQPNGYQQHGVQPSGYQQHGVQQQYKEQTINMMTPGELLIMLYDELVKRLMRCDLALTKKDYQVFEDSADRCIKIVRYLDDTLDSQYPVSRDLHRLYDFFSYELNRIKIGRNKTELDNIRPMIVELRDAFKTADKTAIEQKAGKK